MLIVENKQTFLTLPTLTDASPTAIAILGSAPATPPTEKQRAYPSSSPKAGCALSKSRFHMRIR